MLSVDLSLGCIARGVFRKLNRQQMIVNISIEFVLKRFRAPEHKSEIDHRFGEPVSKPYRISLENSRFILVEARAEYI